MFLVEIDVYYNLRFYMSYKILILLLCFLDNNSCLDLNSLKLGLSYDDLSLVENQQVISECT